MSGTVWIGLCLLLGAIILEIFAPQKLAEGFQTFVPIPQEPGNILTNMIRRRDDVGVGLEHGGLTQDPRYFRGYADVQRYGVKFDFCRMLTQGAADTTFFACALAGTTGDSAGFRTKSIRDGFKMSRDDYMRDIIGDGRDAYCRILKQNDQTYQPMCLRSQDNGFSANDEMDSNPPESIVTLMEFFGGCEVWMRFYDDMLDYTGKTIIQYAGGMKIDQRPNPSVTQALYFNGLDQFVRFGDTSELSLGNVVRMRSIRAFSVWVKFDKFTNNAHIFDFGDGPGVNNTWLGILGKGDNPDDIRPQSSCPETTVPAEKSGAQFCQEMTPQDLYAISAADVNAYTCPGMEMYPKKVDPIQTKKVVPVSNAKRATLQYEVWDKKLRKMQVKINGAIPVDKWTHIVITAKTMDAMRPDVDIYVNGELLYTQEAGYLPQAKVTSNNYLGKSNWTNDFSGYELRDELFNGSMFDFRMYSTNLSEAKIKRTLQWGMKKLGL